MTPYYQDEHLTVYHGDAVEVMATLDAESIDAIVTDPPYDLLSSGGRKGSQRVDSPNSPAGRRAVGFMGKAWDGTGVAFDPETWAAALRVAKPSAYLLAFGGTRTVHRMTCAIEDAGWIIRDMLVWGYASGFPKGRANLKPAWEPVVMARKPGPLRMLNIDECRIGYVSDEERATVNARTGPNSRHREQVGGGVTGSMTKLGERHVDDVTHPAGRWPANIVLTDPIFDGDWEGVVGGGESTSGGNINGRPVTGYSKGWADERWFDGYQDEGTYSRYFLIPKASRSDREPVLGGLAEREAGGHVGQQPGKRMGRSAEEGANVRTLPQRANVHPTVKPTDLMRHLVRLVTPPGGTVLDPFLGSGTTGLAAELEGFPWIGIEKEAEYVAIAEARLNGTQKGMAL